MMLQAFLDERDAVYRVLRHSTVFTAQELAAAEHTSGRYVIKPVVVKADGQFFMCALPACYRIDLTELKSQLLVEELFIVDEMTLAKLFGDCQIGAVPPIGRMFGMITLMDESLINGTRVTFQAGTHEDAVEMSMAEYRRVAQPEMAHFGRPA